MLKFDRNIGAAQHYLLRSVFEEMKVSASQLYNEVETLKKSLSAPLENRSVKHPSSDSDSLSSISLKSWKAESFPDPESWKKRQELCHLLESLLLIDLDFALDQKVEQDLWSFVFRNPIAACQSKAKEQKKADPSHSKNQLASLLETASGFYLQLLQKLCCAYDIDLPCHPRDSVYGLTKEWIGRHPVTVKPRKSSLFYICQHCLVHLGDIGLQKTEKLVTQLVTCLPALVIAEKFETWQLVQMVAVCLFAIEHAWNTDYYRNANSISDVLDSTETSKDSSHVENLLANMLYSFLLPLHASPEPKQTATYYTLPAVKIILDWLLQDPKLFQHNALSKKPQLWPALCKLLNDLDVVSAKPYDCKKFEYIPLPEDWDLQCFLPLKESQKNLKFNLNAETPSDEESVWLRSKRICKLGEALTGDGKKGLNILSTSYSNGRRQFKAVHQGEAGVKQFLQQIHDLAVSTNSVAAVSQPPEITLHATGGGINEHAHPLRLKSHSDNVPQQEVRFKLDDTQQRKVKLDTERDELIDRRTKDNVYCNRDRRIGKNVAMQAILQQRAAQNSSSVLTRTPEFGKESNLLQQDVTIRQSSRPSNHGDAALHIRSNTNRNCVTPQMLSEVNINRNESAYNSEKYGHVQPQQLPSHDSVNALDRGDSWMHSLNMHHQMSSLIPIVVTKSPKSRIGKKDTEVGEFNSRNAVPNVSQVLRGSTLNNYLQNSLPHIIQPSASDFSYHQPQSQPQQPIQPHSLVNRQMSSPSHAYLPNSPSVLWNYMNFMASCQQTRSGSASSNNRQMLMPVNSEHRSPNNQLHQPPSYFMMNNHLQKMPSVDSTVQKSVIHPFRNSDDSRMIPRSEIFREQIHDQLSCQGRPTNMWNQDNGSADRIQTSSPQNQVVGRAVGQAVHPNQQIKDSGKNKATVTTTGHQDMGSNTYSLFNSPWPSGLSVHRSSNENQHGGTADSILMQSRIQSLWSGPGPSPLERLLEQQKHGRDNATL